MRRLRARSAGTRWFEGSSSGRMKIMKPCPYAPRCRHCGPRSTISQHQAPRPARPHEIDSPDKLQKDYDIVCPNCSWAVRGVSLSSLRPIYNLYVFRHVARVRKVATDGRTTESSKECRAGAGATVAG